MKAMRSLQRQLNEKSQIGRSVLLAAAIFALGFAAGNLATSSTSSALGDTDRAFDPFWEAFSIIESDYVDPIAVDVLVAGAIAGMVTALEDEHSAYIPPELCEAMTDFSGTFSGIGVTVHTLADSGQIEVLAVVPDSPAATVGVQPGDIFYEVDGISAIGITQDELSTLVPGPRGSQVSITFQRGSDLVHFDIVRDVFVIPNVSHQMHGGRIAHITLLDFNELSRSQLDAALEALDINSSAGLVFDLRGNSGGTLESAIEIGSAFIADGILLRQVSRDDSEEITRASGSYAEITVPIAVLVDEASASAAEVIAGALQDHQAATIIGEATFGKGTVQNISHLAAGGCLRITIKRWLTPSGAWIHQQGIQPDVLIEWDAQPNQAPQDDLQLQRAIAFLESQRD